MWTLERSTAIELDLSLAESFETKSGKELEELGPPKWLVEGVIKSGGLTLLYGKKGSCKSFVALELGLCVASGMPWFGHPVAEQGPVLYVAAEGEDTVGTRRKAWRERHKVSDIEGCRFLLKMINLRDRGSAANLAKTAREMPERPKLIVIDSLNRAFGAGDENGPEHMSQFVDNCKLISQETGATVLIVHNTGHSYMVGAGKNAVLRDSEHGRGHSSLGDAQETELLVKKTNKAVTLVCKKMRGARYFDDIVLNYEEITLEDGQKSLAFWSDGDELAKRRRDNEERHRRQTDYERKQAWEYAQRMKKLGNPYIVDLAGESGLHQTTEKRHAKGVQDEYGYVEVRRETYEPTGGRRDRVYSLVDEFDPAVEFGAA